jgi:pheromone a factor receptor
MAHLATGLSIYHFYRRRRQFSQVMSSNRGLNQSRYLRLMCLSGVEILGTIPMAAWVLSLNVRAGLVPWHSWADTHRTNNEIPQIPAIAWKNDHISNVLFEFNRWILVACALSFFTFFGFADEARRHYRLVYTSLASRVGLSTSNGKLSGSSHAYVPLWYQDSLLSLRLDSTSSFPHMGSKGGVTVSVMTVSGGQKRDSTISISDQLSIPSISIGSDLKPDFKIEQHYTASSSASSLDAELYDPSSEFTTTTLTSPPATVPPFLSGTVEPTIRPAAPTYVIDTAHAV